MSAANKAPPGSKPYLFNPRNNRVMVATLEKCARRDDNGEPYFIPCDSVHGPSEPMVSTGNDTVVASTKAPAAAKAKAVPAGSVDSKPVVTGLVATIMDENDKDKLVAMGVNMDVKLTKTMKVSTMQDRLKAKLDELAEL